MILRIKIGAFILSPELKATVESLTGDRLFLRSELSVHEGGSRSAIEHLSSNPTPDLLIVETTAENEALFEELGALADSCAPGTRIILVGSENDVNLFKTLIDQGVSQYFVGPPSGDELKAAVMEAFVDKSQGDKSHVIAVAGLRGGVGSSMVAHNVASELSLLKDDDVIIVDMDINFGTAALNFNLQPAQTIVDALAQASSLDEVLLTRYLEACSKNVSLLASPGSLGSGVELSSLTFEPVLKLIKQMAAYVVLDVPHVWNSWVQDILVDADETILVATPDLYNLRDGKNLVEFLSPHRGPEAPIHLVLNRVGQAKNGELKPKEFREVLAINPAVSIPYDIETCTTAMNNGEMLRASSSRAKVTTSIEELAKLVSGKKDDGVGIGNADKKGGLFSSLFKKK
ncbi:MAG: AAA family ATPase [Rhodospirillaceae bacterium]|nr:AAA family ATPase [Rhodospirillaceae bacterium]